MSRGKELFGLLSSARPPKLKTEETYKAVIAKAGLPEDVELFDDYSLCWVGPRTAKSVIVYTCGMPCLPTQGSSLRVDLR